jgi:transcriptional regulator with PAS, ATPase and Fis domain
MLEKPTHVVHSPDRSTLVLRSGILRVAAGANVGDCCTMALTRVRVGTAADNDLVLRDPEVSRHHLELRVADRGYRLVDLGSTNGTYFRGARIHEVEIGLSAEVRLGSTVLRLEPGSVSQEVVASRRTFGTLIGSSEAMQRVYGLLAAVAPTDTTVLIEGETGTGKELVAQEIHKGSPRANQRLVVIDCGALPAGLIESELFGHERGAFTGAEAQREGAFERCRGGTVFLDEIGELPLELQSRLLRVLDQRTVQRVGGNLRRKVDLRLVAATNRDLAKEVRERRFREDLYYRLAVVRVQLPPLRKRREDIVRLARHFLRQAGCTDPEAVLTPDVVASLRSRKWAGNARELRNVLERAVVLVDGASDLVEPERSLAETAAPPALASEVPQEAQPTSGEQVGGYLLRTLPPQLFFLPYKELKRLLIEEMEDLMFGRLLREHGNNISRIAEAAKVDRHLVRKILRRLEQRDASRT